MSESARSSDQLLRIHTGCGTYTHLPQNCLGRITIPLYLEIHDKVDVQMPALVSGPTRFYDHCIVLLIKQFRWDFQNGQILQTFVRRNAKPVKDFKQVALICSTRIYEVTTSARCSAKNWGFKSETADRVPIIKGLIVYGKSRQEKRQLQNSVTGTMMGRITRWEYLSKENNLV